KSSIDEPPEVELKDLPPHLEYAFLEGDDKLPVIIAKDLSIEEKAALIKVLKSRKRAISWKLSDINGTFQRCMLAIFHDMVEKTMEVFMDDFCLWGIYLEFLYRVDKDAQKNTPFIFFDECIQSFETLNKKLTEAPILITPDWDLPFELMCDASDFAIGAVLGQRHEKYFRPIHYASKTMTEVDRITTTTEKEMMSWIFEASRAHGFVLRSQELHILSFIWEIQYPNLID
ncbi:reverse transcriptase domain-containing protein, partial [Tanacetum coccineum]